MENSNEAPYRSFRHTIYCLPGYNLNLGIEDGEPPIDMEPAHIRETFKKFFQAAATE
jgi:hypothetical protein